MNKGPNRAEQEQEAGARAPDSRRGQSKQRRTSWHTLAGQASAYNTYLVSVQNLGRAGANGGGADAWVVVVGVETRNVTTGEVSKRRRTANNGMGTVTE